MELVSTFLLVLLSGHRSSVARPSAYQEQTAAGLDIPMVPQRTSVYETEHTQKNIQTKNKVRYSPLRYTVLLIEALHQMSSWDRPIETGKCEIAQQLN